MMRAIRFAVKLKFKLNTKINYPERLSIVSNERIMDELNKMLLIQPSQSIQLLAKTGLMKYIIPEVLLLNRVNQPPKYHTKDVYKHTLAVVNKVDRLSKELPEKDRLVLALAALFHDMGKPKTMTITNGEIHFFGHADVSEIMSNAIMKRLKYDNDTIETVGNLVSNHMSVMNLASVQNRQRALRRLLERLGEDNLHLLFYLVEADVRSSKTGRTAKFLKVLRKEVKEILQETPKFESPLNGNEIMTLFNLQPSKDVGRIKNYLTQLVIDGDLKQDDKEKAIELATTFWNDQIGR